MLVVVCSCGRRVVGLREQKMPSSKSSRCVRSGEILTSLLFLTIGAQKFLGICCTPLAWDSSHGR